MHELTLVGMVCALFGLGAYRGTGELGIFGAANLAIAAVCLAAAAIAWLRRWRAEGTDGLGSSPVLESVLRCVAILWAAALLQQAASFSDGRLDWTFEGRYQPAPATVNAVRNLPEPATATIFADPNDPRVRRTRLLLEEIARAGNLSVERRDLGDSPRDEDRFAIRSSNSVVFQMGDQWERVDRPTEGAIFEALSYLGQEDRTIVYATTGAGEGDLTETGNVGFSGLAAALETEGVELRLVDSAVLDAVPRDADGLLLLSPERRLHPAMLQAIRSYLEGGGSMIAMLDPGLQSGLETVLAEFGISSEDAVIVDPASDAHGGRSAGVNPIAFNYAEAEVTQGLDRNRRTYFRKSRSFELRKPRPEDRLRAVVFASGDSWLVPTEELASGVAPPSSKPPDAHTDYHPIVVTGVFPRDGGETRIVAFGDSEFADNANLRSLYNLDLAVNAVHWALRRQPAITIRPKAGQLIQFPMPIQSTLKAFYGVGLLVPQLTLLAGGLVWLRRRTA